MKRKKSKLGLEYDRFMALSDEQKTTEVAKYDAEFIADESRPLTAKQQREWERIKRGPGRPKKGSGVSVISISVEQGLLKTADAFAKAHGLNRSDFFSRGAKAVLAANAVA